MVAGGTGGPAEMFDPGTYFNQWIARIPGRASLDGINMVRSAFVKTEDYSLATNFEIKKQSKSRGGYSHYEGGSSTYSYLFYPQFYFLLKQNNEDVKVLIQHENFLNDKNIIIRNYSETSSWGDEPWFQQHFGVVLHMLEEVC